MSEAHSFIPDTQMEDARKTLQGLVEANQSLSQQMERQGAGVRVETLLQMRLEMILEAICPTHLDADAPDDAPCDNLERMHFEIEWQTQVKNLLTECLKEASRMKLLQGVQGVGGVGLANPI